MEIEIRGFFFFSSSSSSSSSSSRVQTTKHLLLQFSNNNNNNRASGIGIVPQRTFRFSANSHVEGRDHELSSSTKLLEVSETALTRDHQHLLIPPPYVVDEHGDVLQKRTPPPCPSALKRLATMSRVSNPGPDGKFPPQVNYLMDFGFSHDQIKDMVRRCPSFAYLTLDGKLKPFIKFLVELGVPQSRILRIMFKQPQLCGLSITQNLLPTMSYLKSLGIDMSWSAKVIHRSPALLTLSRQRIKACVDFFAELGLSEETVGKILKHYPTIVGLSIEDNMKPSMDFFLNKGFTMDEVMFMISRHGALYNYNLVDNIEPKWEFFLKMGYSNSDLVRRPMYFSYSLENRIKPRFSKMVSCGLRVSLSTLLSTSDLKFEEMIRKKTNK